MSRIILLLIALLLQLNNTADAMRCGHKLVLKGDPKVKVMELCGKPADQDRYTLTAHNCSYYYSDTYCYYLPGYYFPIRMEEWIYNFGENRLMRRLLFENGLLVKIQALGYGYKPY